ncbi:hypothetical protein EMPS_03469 [Entomortierella parvispora]|uniref:Uncharacterized protein n=1 Tax=Entomortierella parvispora TaxID=205924 RepID=A0A9P3H6U4_9FUNG|nr:hypothetical protein EMPS_03469 [Entomortierella parvispora]
MQDTTPWTCTSGNNHNRGDSIVSDNNNDIDKETSTNGSGLDRFRASALLAEPSNDFLDNQPSTDPGQHFTSVRRFDRADAQRAALSFLQENSILQPSPSPSEDQQPTTTRSKATFTRITKPRFNAFGSPKLGPSASLLASGSRNNSISTSDSDSFRSYSPSLQEDSASTTTSSPTSSLSPSPPSSSPVWSLRLEEPQQRPSIYHAPAKAQVPSLSLSLSHSLLSPPSAVPSLSSASSYSSYSSSSCSSLSSLSCSPSPPTHCVFPMAEDRHGWWQQRPTPSDLLCAEEEMKSGKVSLVEPRQGTESGRLGSPEEKHPLLLQGATLGNLSESEGETSRDRSSETDSALGSDRVKDEIAGSCCSSSSNNNHNGDLGCSDCPLTPPQQQQPRLNSRGFEQVRPRTTLQNRTRAPSPPSVITGFCSISSKGTSASSGEPSPQDFLGEADLPYPLPSTLQERQARQRKRAEQLRQLKLREEREARESWRRIRRRGASFTAGIPPSNDNNNKNSTSNSAKGRPTSLLMSSSWSSNNQPQPIAAAAGTNHHLKRSPSTPVAKRGNAASAEKTSRRCVGFDLKRTKVFEYDAHEWSPCSTASTPASRQERDNGGEYYDLCRDGTLTSLTGSDSDENNDKDEQDFRTRDEGPRRYRRAATVYPGSKNFMT